MTTQEFLEQAGIKVIEEPYLPPGKILLIDELALCSSQTSGTDIQEVKRWVWEIRNVGDDCA